MVAVVTMARSGAASVSDVTVADVTTRAFSAVWASSEPVTTATVRVFSDAGGTHEITSTLSLTLVSTSFPPALTQGIVKVGVVGLSPNTDVYFQTLTTGSSGTVQFPAAPPFLQVHTATKTIKVNASNQPVANDVLQHDVFAPDGVTPAAGTLLVVAAPNLGAYPLTAFVGEGVPAPAAVVDLTNLFTAASGVNAEVSVGQILTVTEFRGLVCPGLADHKLLRFRRAPAAGTGGGPAPGPVLAPEPPRVTELKAPSECFFADTVCDDMVNTADAQRVLDIFSRTQGQCGFNSDLDIVADHTINILDVQSVLNRSGQSAPFPP
jgi:hypothetical protein